MRALARRVLSPNARHNWHAQRRNLREWGVRDVLRWNGQLIDAAIRQRLTQRSYTMLSEADLIARRRSDTVFIYGSGYSLNSISAAEWADMATHDTFGFTAFIYQRWLRVDYHLLRGGVEGSLNWRQYAEAFCQDLNANPHFAATNFLMQGEYQAQFCNQVLGYKLLRPGANVFRYHTAREDGLPTRRFAEGLRHISGTLSDAVNAAVCMGWRRIVLTGVDLYDSRYFWLPPDKTYELDTTTGLLRAGDVNPRGLRADQTHNTVRIGIVETLGRWHDHLARERGITLEVYNPRSLLADVMPVYAP